MRYFIALLIGFATLLPVGGIGIEQEDPENPNVVFIMADDLGWTDLGCYGSKFFETPNIDRLAESGIRFTQAYSDNPLCSPTRAAILSGMNPARFGILQACCHVGEPKLEALWCDMAENVNHAPSRHLEELSPNEVEMVHPQWTDYSQESLRNLGNGDKITPIPGQK